MVDTDPKLLPLHVQIYFVLVNQATRRTQTDSEDMPDGEVLLLGEKAM